MFLFQVLKRGTIEGNMHGFIYVFYQFFVPPPTLNPPPPSLTHAKMSVNKHCILPPSPPSIWTCFLVSRPLELVLGRNFNV